MQRVAGALAASSYGSCKGRGASCSEAGAYN
jgi:hypothetical protein